MALLAACSDSPAETTIPQETTAPIVETTTPLETTVPVETEAEELGLRHGELLDVTINSIDNIAVIKAKIQPSYNNRATIVQNYLNTIVWLVDDGVGIFEKIKNHFQLADLNEAICELFKGKLTTDAANHSGEGIFFTSKMMDSFLIASDGKIFTTSKFDDGKTVDLDTHGKGTCVLMSLSNFTHKTPKEIFDQYSDSDGSFSTTKIPLKNIFDAAPVSRSQAKRVCNRLEQFTEAILDFDGIEWMGQGFAHQIFVVFQNNHPEIALVPQNMSDSVKSMYDHVINSR